MEETEVQLARIEEKVENILRSVECLPELCEIQARHDERIVSLEQGGKWALGIIATVLSGLMLAFITLARDFLGRIMIGGRP